MTIHSEHPFATPDGDRDPVRRFRGRMPAPVSVWTTGGHEGGERAGLTVSSFVVADGDPPRVAGLVDEDSDLVERLADEPLFAISLLAAGQGEVGEVFGGQAPAPGGVFTRGSWRDSPWGPVLDGAAGWLGCRRTTAGSDLPHLGWALLVEGTVEHAEVADASVAALVHVRGRYLRP